MGLIMRAFATAVYLAMHAFAIYLLDKAFIALDYKTAFYVTACCTLEGFLNTFLYFNEHIQSKIYTHLNNLFGDKILDADMHMFSVYSPGDVIHIWDNIKEISQIVNISFDWLKSFFGCIVNFVAIYLIMPQYALINFSIFTMIGVVMYFLNKRWEELCVSCNKMNGVRNVVLDEAINGFGEIRNFTGTIDYMHKIIHENNTNIYHTIKNQKRLSALMTFIIETTASICTGVGIIMAIALIHDGQINIGIAKNVILYSWAVCAPAVEIVFRSSDIMQIWYVVSEYTKFMQFENTVHCGKLTLTEFNKMIEFKNVSFAYNSTDTVLRNINITIHKGDHIGICGPSGNGKSTFIKLLTHQYDVLEGEILIDNVNIRDISNESLRKHMNSVNQDTFIFDGTIRDNIAYALRPLSVSDDRILDACKNANLYKFIMHLPEQLDTKVGPRGLKLSGGQKQRIALARVFLANPDIIILDEATSALDNESERKVKKAINMLDSTPGENKTIISIAHRLTTIQHCDQIYYIGDNHEIVESGTHKELLALNGEYAHMWYNNDDDDE